MRTHSKLSILALITIVVGALLSASCSSNEPAPQSQSSTATTKPAGSLTVSVNFYNSRMDPAYATPNTFQSISAGVYDSLIELTSEGKSRPGIAERWEISPDGKDHTFYIRKGVKFQDGSDLTGADVKFSLDRMLKPEITHSDKTVWQRMLDNVELKDDYTVVMHLKQPLYEAMLGIDALSGAGAVLPKKYIDEKGADYFGTHPMGSGPWKVVKLEPGARIEFEANENHWRSVPKIKNITYLNVGDEATRVAMLKTGELDLAEIAPESAAQLKTAGVKVVSHDGGAQAFGFMYYNPQNPLQFAIGDQRVRKALSLALNRKEIADQLYAGYAEPSGIVYVRPTAYFWDANLFKADPYDPEGAKKLLAEAGYADGFSMTLLDTSTGVVSSNLTQAIGGYWRKVGVKADVKVVDFASVAMQLNDATPSAWNSIRFPTHGGGVWNFERIPASYTLGSWANKTNKKLDEAITKVNATRDQAERKKLAIEAAVLAKDNMDFIPVLDVRTVFAVGKKVGEFKPTTGMVGIGPSLETMTIAK